MSLITNGTEFAFNREFEKTKMATARGTLLNIRFNEQNNGWAHAL